MGFFISAGRVVRAKPYGPVFDFAFDFGAPLVGGTAFFAEKGVVSIPF